MPPLRLLLLLAVAWLAGCAALPPRGEPPASHAVADTADTTLGRIAAASLPACSGPGCGSGFRLLPTGEFAFNGRLALVQRAERTLDVQTYHLHRDHAGRALLGALRDAAARGVRVRLLVDDLYVAETDDLLAALSLQPGIEVRVFNPLPLRHGTAVMRLALSRGDFERMNHRMHNKLFVADNQIAVYGGRNVGDEYYMTNADANFIDLDVVSTGQVVQDMSAVFDRYWNSEAAWPLFTVMPRPADAAAARSAFDAAVAGMGMVPLNYKTDPLGGVPLEHELAAGRITQTPGHAEVHPDPPEKALAARLSGEPTAAMTGLLHAIAGAKQSVVIVSPYFVPSDIGMGMMQRAAEAGVRTVVYTNSLGSTDEPLVHRMYARYRQAMLKIGVHLHEFNGRAVKRGLGFGRFGRSTPRLHAKVTVVDDARLLVGSVNLDARSAVGNTEMGVVIDSRVLPAQLRRLMGDEKTGTVYTLRLADDGSIEWLTTGDDDKPLLLHDEPDDGPWLRFKNWLESLFVEERLL